MSSLLMQVSFPYQLCSGTAFHVFCSKPLLSSTFSFSALLLSPLHFIIIIIIIIIVVVVVIIIIIVPKNVYILLSLLLSVYEQIRVSIFFSFY